MDNRGSTVLKNIKMNIISVINHECKQYSKINIDLYRIWNYFIPDQQVILFIYLKYWFRKRYIYIYIIYLFH